MNGNYNAKVHREVFYLTHGFYPPVVRHLCDTPLCINPKHLLGGTVLENIQDRNKRGRTRNHVSKKLASKVFKLRRKGLTYKQISEILGYTYKKIEYILLQWSKDR